MIETVILPVATADVFADKSCTPLLAEGQRIAYKVCLCQASLLESGNRLHLLMVGLQRCLGLPWGKDMGSMISCYSLQFSL